MNFKVGMASFGAATLLMYSGYQNIDNGNQLFLAQRLEADEIAFMDFIQKHGKSYRTKEEYMFRFELFKK